MVVWCQKMAQDEDQGGGKLEKHFSSKTHRASLNDYITFVENMNIDIQLEKQTRHNLLKEQEELIINTESVEILLDIAKTVGRQGLAFRGDTEINGNFQQVVQLVGRHCPNFKQWLSNRYGQPHKVSYCSQVLKMNLLNQQLITVITSEMMSYRKYSDQEFFQYQQIQLQMFPIRTGWHVLSVMQMKKVYQQKGY